MATITRCSLGALLLCALACQLSAIIAEEDPSERCALLQHSADVFVRTARPSQVAGGDVGSQQAELPQWSMSRLQRHSTRPAVPHASDKRAALAQSAQRSTEDPELTWVVDEDGFNGDEFTLFFVGCLVLMSMLMVWALLVCGLMLRDDTETHTKRMSSLKAQQPGGKEGAEPGPKGALAEAPSDEAHAGSAGCPRCGRETSWCDGLFGLAPPCEFCWEGSVATPQLLSDILLTDSS